MWGEEVVEFCLNIDMQRKNKIFGFKILLFSVHFRTITYLCHYTRNTVARE